MGSNVDWLHLFLETASLVAGTATNTDADTDDDGDHYKSNGKADGSLCGFLTSFFPFGVPLVFPCVTTKYVRVLVAENVMFWALTDVFVLLAKVIFFWAAAVAHEEVHFVIVSTASCTATTDTAAISHRAIIYFAS